MKPIRALKGYLRPFGRKRCPFKLKRIIPFFAYLLTITGFSTAIQYSAAAQDKDDQNYRLTGKVVSAEDLGPLPGATVLIAGSDKGSGTDSDGIFSINAVRNSITLNVSFLGYLPVDTLLQLPLKEELVIVLRKDAAMLETAVVKGYYTTSKEFNTGSVSTVSSEILEKQPVSDPMLDLQGRVPGLHISQTSGVPGAAPEITLRGRNSIANGNDPLYIIDGVPFTSESLSLVYGGDVFISPFASIGINNIERIDILKDADATAIYGSRGANGVILITTKSGKPGKTTFSLDVNRGIGKIVNGYDLMNTREYLEMRREAFRNDQTQPGDEHYDVNGTWDTSRFTDWENVLIGGTAQLTNLHASVSGGSQQTQFLLSGGYRKETTVFPGEYRNRKISFQSNINHRSGNNRFSSNFSLIYSDDNNLLPTSDFTKSIVIPPNAPALYNEDGSLNWGNSTWYNPFASLYQTSTSHTKNLNGALNISYKVTPGLRVSGRLGYNNIRMETTNLIPGSSVDPANVILDNIRQNHSAQNELSSWIIEPRASFDKSFGELSFESVIGSTFQQNQQEGVSLRARGFTSDALLENKNAATDLRFGQMIFSQYRYIGLYARLGVSYLNRYVINLTGRRDGSSRFGPGKQFGDFGALGVAWIFSDSRYITEKWPFISYGKLRMSYGTTGNDQIGDYKYLGTYAANGLNFQEIVGLNPVQHTNPEFRWETVRKLEAGLELGLFEDKVALNVSWYRNRTDNQLVGYTLPSMTGFSMVQANLPAIVQNSGVEIDLGYDLIISKAFSWTARANLSIPRNKLVSYPGIESSSYKNRYLVGMPLSINYMYHFEGVNPEDGLAVFSDLNRDGTITLAQDRLPVFVGQNFFGSLNNNLSYKGFRLDISLQFVKQTGYKEHAVGFPGFFATSQGNQPRSFLDRWIQPGDRSDYPRFSQLFGSEAMTSYRRYSDSDAMVVDASYIRLKNISLAWVIPEAMLNWLPLRGLTVYMRMRNALTFTAYQGVDPEISTARSIVLPPLKMITTGLQVSL